MDTYKIRNGIRSLLFGIQKRARIIFLTFLLGSLSGILALRGIIWPLFETVMRSKLSETASEKVSIIVLTPFDVFLVQVKVGIIIGILLTLPIIIYVIYSDVLERSGIKVSRVPKSVILLVGTVGIILFIAGLAYSYKVFFPLVFEFLVNITINSGFGATYAIAEWTQFMLILSISFGLAGQIPLFLPVLVRYKAIKYETVKNGWRYWIVITLSLGAVLSPPEPVSQLLWAVPLIVLYAISIGISKLANPVESTPDENTNDIGKKKAQVEAKQETDIKHAVNNGVGFEQGWIGSYGEDITKILSAVSSNIKIIGVFFLLSMFISFYTLFDSGVEIALDTLRASIENQDIVNIIALHPVELLIFEAKLSVVIGIIATIPVCIWKIWPEIKDKDVVSSGREIGILYASVIIAAFLSGCAIGFLYIVPEGLNLLSLDAQRIDAIVSYRIRSFFWISFYASITVGMMFVSAITPILSYVHSGAQNVIVEKWRVVLFGLLLISVVITPSSILRAMVFFIPIGIMYGSSILVVEILNFVR